MRFGSPLRYPGGKAKLTDFFKLVLEENTLFKGHYVEPYAGGAGIAINLLLQNYVTYIHLNDLNHFVYTFWHVLINDPDGLSKLINDTEVSMDEWRRQKEIFTDPSNHTPLETAFSTFFLNRTNRSGIIWGGVIGGKNQSGDWKLDARYNKSELISRIEKISHHSSNIRLYNLDAKVLITDVLPFLPKETLVYLDPPYYVKGKGLYQNHYLHNDHVAIAKLVTEKIRQPWIVSYDHTPEIVAMYKGCPTIEYGINYSAQDRYKGAEVMYFSDCLAIPYVKNPIKLKIA